MASMRAAAAAVLIGLAAAGCGRFGFHRGAADTISREHYIEAVVALRRVNGPMNDSVAFRARRDSILRSRGLTAADLARFAEVHGEDVPFMTSVWDTVEARLRSVPESARAGAPAPSTAAPGKATPRSR